MELKQTVIQALQWAETKLKESGLECGCLDAEVLLAHILGTSRWQLYLERDLALSASAWEGFCLAIERRVLREPVAYITGTKEFMSLDFKVNGNVLVPRPETELLVEEIIAYRPARAVDVGTGSGAIAVSVAVYLRETEVIAVDISEDALAVAKANALKHGVQHRVDFLQGDLLTPVMDSGGRDIDLIAANLPYISSEDMTGLPPDVLYYEPELALNGGLKGYELYQRFLSMVPYVLRSGGRLLIEIGEEQGQFLQSHMNGMDCFGEVKVLKDYTGKDRLISTDLL